MKSYARLWLPISIGGFFLFLDQLLKWLSLNIWNGHNLITSYFGWQPFVNSGVAFGIKMPLWTIFLVTVPILGLVGHMAVNEYKKQNPHVFFAWTLLFLGAFSNFFDRLVYNSVIDYFLIGISLINLADVMIVVGLGMAVLERWRERG